MKTEKSVSWLLAALLLGAIIIVSGVIIATRLGGRQPLEVSLAPEEQLQGRIYVGGEVNNPGYYPLRPDDSIEDIVAAAGGLTEGADLGGVRLMVAPASSEAPQKVDINRAEAWLLEALPGVGETRAQAIIDYRRTYGPFRDIYELTNVPGFGDTTFDGVKDLITVAGSAE